MKRYRDWRVRRAADLLLDVYYDDQLRLSQEGKPLPIEALVVEGWLLTFTGDCELAQECAREYVVEHFKRVLNQIA